MALKLSIILVSVAITLLIFYLIDRKKFLDVVRDTRSGKMGFLDYLALALQILFVALIVAEAIVLLISAYNHFK